MARKLSLWTLVASAALLLAVLGLGALAFADRKLQYASFVAGWRLTSWASATALVVQGTMAVWLSFWVTAFFFHKYSPKLVLFVGFAVPYPIGRAVLFMMSWPQIVTGTLAVVGARFLLNHSSLGGNK